jgi:hypothetical protein
MTSSEKQALQWLSARTKLMRSQHFLQIKATQQVLLKSQWAKSYVSTIAQLHMWLQNFLNYAKPKQKLCLEFSEHMFNG